MSQSDLIALSRRLKNDILHGSSSNVNTFHANTHLLKFVCKTIETKSHVQNSA